MYDIRPKISDLRNARCGASCSRGFLSFFVNPYPETELLSVSEEQRRATSRRRLFFTCALIVAVLFVRIATFEFYRRFWILTSPTVCISRQKEKCSGTSGFQVI